MPSPSVPGPREPRPLSARERAVLAGIERELDASAPALAREMARIEDPGPSTHGPSSGRLVESGLLLAALVLVLAAAGWVPGVAWAVLGVIATMALVPWLMLRMFAWHEHRESDHDERDGPAN